MLGALPGKTGAMAIEPPPDAAVITPYRDGPLLVRGPFRLQDQSGREIVNERGTVALCRCGKSRMRPFCDGSHKLVRFQAPSEAEDRGRSPGGDAAERGPDHAERGRDGADRGRRA